MTDTEKAFEALISARIKMLIRHPFWGNMATRLLLVEDNSIETAATDGRKLYFNSLFILKLRPEEVIFLVGHELLHCVYEHLERFGTRVNRIANIAADYVANADLIEYKVGERITTIPCLFDEAYKGMSFEEVYDIIYKKNKCDNDALKALEDMLLDSHLDLSGMSDEDKQALRDDIREAMISAAEAVGAGNVPGSIKKLLNKFTEPQMDWRAILRSQIESQVKDDYSFSRPNRRGWHMDAILPSQKTQPAIQVHCAIDESGSISEKERSDFLSEVKGIMEQYQDYSVFVGSWDTEFHGFEEFSSDNGNNLMEYEAKGGGGTDAGAIWRWMKENDVEPKQMVVFTDGFIPSNCWGDPYYCPTTWLIYKSKSIIAPFGETIVYE